ncbi:MAG: hypothetical protein JAY62_09115, partial [Candidatus Thiodiazotropha endolucinida]|nr:hypothetical protein [Candidatus Thiodiazotropha taylori]MCW4275272.1 hypothetical protein [Candidatus Thiodiazotropha taylori]
RSRGIYLLRFLGLASSVSITSIAFTLYLAEPGLSQQLQIVQHAGTEAAFQSTLTIKLVSSLTVERISILLSAGVCLPLYNQYVRNLKPV